MQFDTEQFTHSQCSRCKVCVLASVYVYVCVYVRVYLCVRQRTPVSVCIGGQSGTEQVGDEILHRIQSYCFVQTDIIHFYA